jgi:hypothetical protein
MIFFWLPATFKFAVVAKVVYKMSSSESLGLGSYGITLSAVTNI